LNTFWLVWDVLLQGSRKRQVSLWLSGKTESDDFSVEADGLLPYLLTTSPDHRELGTELQDKVSAFRTKMQKCLDESWQRKEEVDAAKRKAMGEEELDASREQWLKEQRKMHGQPEEQVGGIAGVKPVLPEWKTKCKFL
jgi:hypothetical protein